MVSPLLQQKLARNGETRKRKTSNQSKEPTVGSSKRAKSDSKIPKKTKRHAVIKSDDKDGEELRRTESSDSDSGATDSAEYEIEKIVSKRVGNDGTVYYTVRWKNYPPEADSEAPAYNVNAPELIRKFEQEQQSLQERSSERNTLPPQLPTTSRSKHLTSTLPNKVANKNVAKTLQKGPTSLPREESASANPPLQKGTQKQSFDTVAKSPLKQAASDVLTSRTPVEELPSVHADDSSNVSNVQSKPSNSKAPVRLAAPMMPARKEAPAISNDGMFILGKKKFETMAGLPPKERMVLRERREREAQERMSTENAFKAHPEVPTSQINDKIKSKTNERTSMATPAEPQDNRMSNEEASTAISTSLTQQEANPSITKTIRKDVKARETQPFQCVITKTTNDGDNSQLSEGQSDIIKHEMSEENANQREEEDWRREKEQKRQESLARRIQAAEEKKRLEAQKSAKASKGTGGIYDPRAASSFNNDDEIFDPRAVENHEAFTNVSLPRKNPPSLPPCLLDRGIKIEKILKLFSVKDEVVGLCQYKNCLLLQIVAVKRIKEVDPMALLRAYESLYWDTPTNE